MKPPLFSIIIPVYNVEKYIARCLDSLYNQEFEEHNYEVIIVNDGTLDNSMSIVDSYAKYHKNMFIVNKVNGGVSSARNAGIQEAKGEYIIFIDSDDTIQVNSLKLVSLELEKENVEVLLLNSYIYNEISGQKVAVYPYPSHLKGKVITGVELFQNGYLAKGSVWGATYKRSFILENRLYFHESVINGEDMLFVAVALTISLKLKHVDIDFYYIRTRMGSASNSWDYCRLKIMCNNFSAIQTYIEEKSFSSDQMEIIHFHIYITISNIVNHFFLIHRLDKYFEVKRAIVGSVYYPIKSGQLKQCKWKIRLLNISYDLYCIPFFLRQMHKDIFIK